MAYNQDIHSQTKNVIFHVYNYFKMIATDESKPEFSDFFLQTREVTSKAGGCKKSLF